MTGVGVTVGVLIGKVGVNLGVGVIPGVGVTPEAGVAVGIDLVEVLLGVAVDLVIVGIAVGVTFAIGCDGLPDTLNGKITGSNIRKTIPSINVTINTQPVFS